MMGFEHFGNKTVFFMTGLTKKMSRRVRCSNGKRAGFINAKIIKYFIVFFHTNQDLTFLMLYQYMYAKFLMPCVYIQQTEV